MFLEIFGSSAVLSVVAGAAAILIYQYYLQQTERHPVSSEAVETLDVEYRKNSFNCNPHIGFRRHTLIHNVNKVSVFDSRIPKENGEVAKEKALCAKQENFETKCEKIFNSVIHDSENINKEYEKNIYEGINFTSEYNKGFEQNKNHVKYVTEEESLNQGKVLNVNLLSNSPSNKDEMNLIQSTFSKHASYFSPRQQRGTVTESDEKCCQCMLQKTNCQCLNYNNEVQLMDVIPSNENYFLENEKKVKNIKEDLTKQLCEFSNNSNDNFAYKNSIKTESNALGSNASSYISSLGDTVNCIEHSNQELNEAYNINLHKAVGYGKESRFYRHIVCYSDLNLKENFNSLLVEPSNAGFSVQNGSIAKEQCEKSELNNMSLTAREKYKQSIMADRHRLYLKYKNQKAVYSDFALENKDQLLIANTFIDNHASSALMIEEPANISSRHKHKLRNVYETDHKVERCGNFENLDCHQLQNANPAFDAEKLLSNIRLKVNSLEIKKYIPHKIKTFFATVKDQINNSCDENVTSSHLISASKFGERVTANTDSLNSSVTNTEDLKNFNSQSEQELCKGCMEMLADVVSIPCGHCYLCAQCAKIVSKIYKKCCICHINVISFERITAEENFLK